MCLKLALLSDGRNPKPKKKKPSFFANCLNPADGGEVDRAVLQVQ